MDAPIDLPHHRQETEHTCGPAALKMVLDALSASPVPEPVLEAALGTQPDIGTRQVVMQRFMEERGHDVRVRHTDTRLEEIAQAMDNGEVVIVCYWLGHENTDHYAVVTAIRPGAVILHDPWEGPEYVVATEQFEHDWIADTDVPGRRHRWMMAIKVV